MTVPYSHEAATARVTMLLNMLFFRWDGSVWQLIYLELIVWSAFYLAINRIHYYFLKDEYAKFLEDTVDMIHAHMQPSMLHFLLGFFTMITVTRWWKVYGLMEWPDSVSSSLSVHLRQSTSNLSATKVRILRRTMAKHLQLAFVLLLRDICGAMRKRFPSMESIGESKLLLNEQERKMIRSVGKKVPPEWCLYWLPFHWLFLNLKRYYFVDFGSRSFIKEKFKRTREVYKASLFFNKYEYLHVIKELLEYRQRMGDMLMYDFVAAPTLAFTQAIIFAVYGYVIFAAISRQNLGGELSYLSVASAIVEVAIYLAWLKCTLVMINPFGDDRDDFEILWLTDRHWRVIYRTLNDPWRLFPKTTFTRSAHHSRRRQFEHTFASAWQNFSDDPTRIGGVSEDVSVESVRVPLLAAMNRANAGDEWWSGTDVDEKGRVGGGGMFRSRWWADAWSYARFWQSDGDVSEQMKAEEEEDDDSLWYRFRQLFCYDLSDWSMEKEIRPS